jgi:3-deoxy-D-manno-octulosonate 8-phosphate phosphatase (KDO 8-P phosphatase)
MIDLNLWRVNLMKTRTATPRIPLSTLRQRAHSLRLVLTDSDGVLTDTGVFYSTDGEAMKRFSIRDGMGVERLRADGVETAIMTGEVSGSVRRRAEKLAMPYLYLGIKDKKKHLDSVLRETGFSLDQLAYIGDDVNDLEVILAIHPEGITAAPADAVPEIARAVHYRCKKNGGAGAFREFAEWLLSLRATSGRSR